jgi:hypothetical protein
MNQQLHCLALKLLIVSLLYLLFFRGLSHFTLSFRVRQIRGGSGRDLRGDRWAANGKQKPGSTEGKHKKQKCVWKRFRELLTHTLQERFPEVQILTESGIVPQNYGHPPKH